MSKFIEYEKNNTICFRLLGLFTAIKELIIIHGVVILITIDERILLASFP